jgi:FkbM family methyltransferase
MGEDRERSRRGFKLRKIPPFRVILGNENGWKGSRIMMGFLEKWFNMLAALEHPGTLKEFITSKAFSVPCLRLSQALKCHQPHFGTILDVGANVGQFALAAALYFPDARIYSFEPLPDVFRELQENTRRKENIQSFNCALGNRNGRTSFRRNAYTRLSSFLNIHEQNDHPRYRERKTSWVQVDIVRLDELSMLSNLPHPVLLKLDVQGMEMEVLMGGRQFLSQVDFILCEAALVGLYDDQPLFDDLHALAHRLGYELVAPLILNKGKGGRVIEVDLLYEKKVNAGEVFTPLCQRS